MILRRIVAAVSLTAAAALTVQTGVSNAAPADPTYTAKAGANNTVLLSVAHGLVKASADASALEIVDTDGAVRARLPLALPVGKFVMPIRSDVAADATSATLVPDIAGLARDFRVNTGTPIEQQMARNELQQQLDIAMKVGGPIGGVIGAVVGCAIGFIGLVAGIIVGCPVGIAVGTVVGTAVAGGGQLANAWNDFNFSISGPNCSTRFAPYDRVVCNPPR